MAEPTATYGITLENAPDKIASFNNSWNQSRRESQGTQYYQQQEVFNRELASVGYNGGTPQDLGTGGFDPRTGRAYPGVSDETHPIQNDPTQIINESDRAAAIAKAEAFKQSDKSAYEQRYAPEYRRAMEPQVAPIQTNFSPKVIDEFTKLVEAGKLPQGARISDWVNGKLQPASAEYSYAPAKQATPNFYAPKTYAEAELADQNAAASQLGLTLTYVMDNWNVKQDYGDFGNTTLKERFYKNNLYTNVGEYAEGKITGGYYEGVAPKVDYSKAFSSKDQFKNQFSPAPPIGYEVVGGVSLLNGGSIAYLAPSVKTPLEISSPFTTSASTLPPVLQTVVRGEETATLMYENFGEFFRQLPGIKQGAGLLDSGKQMLLAQNPQKEETYMTMIPQINDFSSIPVVARSFGAEFVFGLPEMIVKLPQAAIGAGKVALFTGYDLLEGGKGKSSNYAQAEIGDFGSQTMKQLITPEGFGSILGQTSAFGFAELGIGAGISKLTTRPTEITGVRATGILTEEGISTIGEIVNPKSGKAVKTAPFDTSRKLLPGEVGEAGARMLSKDAPAITADTYGGMQRGVIVGKVYPSPLDRVSIPIKNFVEQGKGIIRGDTALQLERVAPKETILGTYEIDVTGAKFKQPQLIQDEILGNLQKVQIESTATGTAKLFTGKVQEMPINIRFFSKTEKGFTGDVPTVNAYPGFQIGEQGTWLRGSTAQTLIGEGINFGIPKIEFGKLTPVAENPTYVAGYATTFRTPKEKLYTTPNGKEVVYRYRYSPESSTKAFDLYEAANKRIGIQHYSFPSSKSASVERLISDEAGIIQVTKITNPYIQEAINQNLLQDYSIGGVKRRTQTTKKIGSEKGVGIYDARVDMSHFQEVSLVGSGADPLSRFTKIDTPNLNPVDIQKKVRASAEASESLTPKQTSALNNLINKAETYDRLTMRGVSGEEALRGVDYISPPETGLSIPPRGGKVGSANRVVGEEPKTNYVNLPKEVEYTKTLYRGTMGGKPVQGFARSVDVIKFDTPAGEATLSTGSTIARKGLTQATEKPLQVDALNFDVRGTNIKSFSQLERVLRGEEPRYNPKKGMPKRGYAQADVAEIVGTTLANAPAPINLPAPRFPLLIGGAVLPYTPTLPPVIFGVDFGVGFGGTIQFVKQKPQAAITYETKTQGGMVQVQIQKPIQVQKPPAQLTILEPKAITQEPTKTVPRQKPYQQQPYYDQQLYDKPFSATQPEEKYTQKPSLVYGGVDFGKYSTASKNREATQVSQSMFIGATTGTGEAQKVGEGQKTKEGQQQTVAERMGLSYPEPSPQTGKILERYQTGTRITNPPPPPPPTGGRIDVPPPTPPIWGTTGKKKRKQFKQPKAMKFNLRGTPVGILPDYLSSIKSQFKYGKSTAVLVSKQPSYAKYGGNYIGYAPTAEQLEGGKGKKKKPQFKLGGFSLGKY